MMEVIYLHYDQVGSLRAVSDNNHNIIKEIVYDSFGNIVSDSNPNIKVPFVFAGGLYDEDTKLLRFGYRDYDSFTGKWTAKDPIDFDGDGYNLYEYVLNDPINFVDPEGFASCSAAKKESIMQLIHRKNRNERQKVAEEMFDAVSNLGDGVTYIGIATKNPKLIAIGTSISTASTTMKYLVKPDKAQDHEVINDYLPPHFYITPLNPEGE